MSRPWGTLLVGGILALTASVPLRADTVSVATIGVGAVVELPALIDNFDDGNDVNFWGGAMGVVPDGSLAHTYDAGTTRLGSGQSLKLTYNLSLATSGYSAFFLKLGVLTGDGVVPADVSMDRQLTFWVKGQTGGTEHLKIQLNNKSVVTARQTASLYVNDYLDGGISNTWKQVRIPLDAFANLDSLTNVTELTFVFETAYATANGYPFSGTVYIDDVSITTEPITVLRLDSFGDNWGWGALGGNTGDMGTASHSFTTTTVGEFHNFARALRSDYNVNPGNPTFAGHFILLGGAADGWTAVPLNLSRYRFLRFWARAQNTGGNPGQFKIELISSAGTALLPLTGLTTTWGQFVFDLNSFSSAVLDKTSIKQMNILYEDTVVAHKVGSVFFDEIEFSE